MATRSSGEMRLCSKEYFTKNATPRNRASPPIHAKSFAPMNCSQLIVGSEGCGADRSAEGDLGGTGGGTDVAAANTSSGKGGGMETGRTSRESAIGGGTKGSRCALSSRTANGRSADGSPGACLNLCNSASRLRNL